MRWILSFMAMLPALDFLSRWYLSRDVDYPEGCELPYKWLCWGTCRAIGGRNYDCRYFLFRLPSYAWMQIDCGHRYGWVQRCVFMFNGKWSIGFAMPMPSVRLAGA